MKLYEIIPGKLYQRGCPRPAQLPELQRFELIIGLAGPYLEWLQLAPGSRYLHHRIPDGIRTPDLRVPLALIDSTLPMEGSEILIFCNAGRNRSSLLSARVLIERGMPPAKAIEYIRSVRPNALANESFVQYLLGVKP